jgi:hypothetical protein
VTSYRCDGCGVVNRAVNDRSGMAHTRTGGKRSGCDGRWMRLEGAKGEEVVLFEGA